MADSPKKADSLDRASAAEQADVEFRETVVDFGRVTVARHGEHAGRELASCFDKPSRLVRRTKIGQIAAEQDQVDTAVECGRRIDDAAHGRLVRVQVGDGEQFHGLLSAGDVSATGRGIFREFMRRRQGRRRLIAS